MPCLCANLACSQQAFTISASHISSRLLFSHIASLLPKSVLAPKVIYKSSGFMGPPIRPLSLFWKGMAKGRRNCIFLTKVKRTVEM